MKYFPRLSLDEFEMVAFWQPSQQSLESFEIAVQSLSGVLPCPQRLAVTVYPDPVGPYGVATNAELELHTSVRGFESPVSKTHPHLLSVLSPSPVPCPRHIAWLWTHCE